MQKEELTSKPTHALLPPHTPQSSTTLPLLGRVRGGGKGIAVVKWRDDRGPVGHAVAAGARGSRAAANGARVDGS